MSGASVIEAVLLRANESHTKAGTTRTVTLLLPNDGEHPFRGLACGPDNGQRMAISIALIGDDEIQSEPVKEKRKFRELSRAQQAGMLCAETSFQAFLTKQHNVIYILQFGTHEDQAADFVRGMCMVGSRSELDTDEASGEVWDKLYHEYQAWMARG